MKNKSKASIASFLAENDHFTFIEDQDVRIKHDNKRETSFFHLYVWSSSHHKQERKHPAKPSQFVAFVVLKEGLQNVFS